MESEKNTKEVGLKHLGFVRIAAIHVLVCVSNLYDYAKQNSGPLKSTVETVDGAVSSVFTPVYHKFKNVPDSLLVFLDNKVDEVSDKFDKHAPLMAKQVLCQVQLLTQKATDVAQNFVKEAQTSGSKAALNYAATEYKYFLVTNSVRVWAKLNQYKPIHMVSNIASPLAANLSGKYNHLVKNMSHKGYPLFGYLPFVPVDDIVKAYEKENAPRKEGNTKIDGNKSSSDSDSD